MPTNNAYKKQTKQGDAVKTDRKSEAIGPAPASTGIPSGINGRRSTLHSCQPSDEKKLRIMARRRYKRHTDPHKPETRQA